MFLVLEKYDPKVSPYCRMKLGISVFPTAALEEPQMLLERTALIPDFAVPMFSARSNNRAGDRRGLLGNPDAQRGLNKQPKECNC